MPSITKQVWEILDNDITIKRDLERGIINVSALSQYLLDTYKVQGSLDSVISAVRRYKGESGAHDDYAKISTALKNAIVSTKTHISLLTLRNSPTTYTYLGKLMAHEDFVKNDVFRLIKTRSGVQIIVDRDSMEKAKSAFPAAAVEGTVHNLADISVKLTQEGWGTQGVLSRIANELATQGINIEMIFSAYPTVSIFLREKDLVKAHEALLRISGR